MDPAPTPLELAASDWVARRERGLTAAEQDTFFQWLGEDPGHGEAYARLQQVANRLKILAQWRPEYSSRPNPDLLAIPVRQSHRWLIPLGLAAALAVIGFYSFPRATPPEPAPTVSVLRKVLEDGSTIDLAGNARVEVTYTPTQRNVRLLAGEANFHVAKNPRRPFIVNAAGVQIRAVGTAFNVGLKAQSVEVLVTEGKVKVTQAEAGSILPILEAGQRTSVSLNEAKTPAVEPVSAFELTRVTSWKARQLEFNDTPLAQVAAEFNNDNTLKLVVDDPVLAALPIGASIRSDNVEGFVRLLESTFSVRAERRADGVIVLQR